MKVLACPVLKIMVPHFHQSFGFIEFCAQGKENFRLRYGPAAFKGLWMGSGPRFLLALIEIVKHYRPPMTTHPSDCQHC